MRVTAALLVLASFCVGSSAQAQRTVVIRDVSVLPMTSRAGTEVLPHQTLVMSNGRIDWIGADRDARVPVGAEIINGAGKFVMPGLADMHVHTDPRTLPLFLSFGVTTIRELNGSPELLALRDSINAGQRVGPRMYVSSPLLIGEPTRYRHVVVTSADSARTLVRRYKAERYDLVKVYDALRPDVYAALVAEARAQGLPITGHIPQAVGLDGILAAHQDIEHVEKIVYVTVGVQNPDTLQARAIARRIAAAGIAVTPTLASQKALALARSAEYQSWLERPEMSAMDTGTIAWWKQFAPRASGATPPSARALAVHAFQKVLTRELYSAGVPLLVGTDTPNPLMVPGAALHDEIATMVEAGLPIAFVLRAATAGAAEHVQEAGQWGVVAKGARADLVLVERNPLQDPAVLRRPTRVLLRGRWIN